MCEYVDEIISYIALTTKLLLLLLGLNKGILTITFNLEVSLFVVNEQRKLELYSCHAVLIYFKVLLLGAYVECEKINSFPFVPVVPSVPCDPVEPLVP